MVSTLTVIPDSTVTYSNQYWLPTSNPLPKIYPTAPPDDTLTVVNQEVPYFDWSQSSALFEGSQSTQRVGGYGVGISPEFKDSRGVETTLNGAQLVGVSSKDLERTNQGSAQGGSATYTSTGVIGGAYSSTPSNKGMYIAAAAVALIVLFSVHK